MTEQTFWWSDENVAILKEQYHKIGPTKLAKLLGTSRMSVTTKAKRLGIPRMEQHAQPYEWTEAMLVKMVALYPTADAETLVREIGLPLSSIRDKARKMGLRGIMRSKRAGQSLAEGNTTLNYRFFDEWSPDMAYVLGFLFADGSITKRQGEAIIGLSIKDIDILRWIKKTLNSTRKFYTRGPLVDAQGRHHAKSVFLTLASKIMVKRLMELGMMPRKTYNDDPFPIVPDEHAQHFARGYFDGDGGVILNKREGRCAAKIVGSVKFITGLAAMLARLAGVLSPRVFVEQGIDAEYARITWTATGDLHKLRDFMYPPGFSYCLKRKKKRLDLWLKDHPSKETIP